MTTLFIKKIISNGYGIAWEDGATWFVPFVIPEETIEVLAYRTRKKIRYVTEFRVITPSPYRISPNCPYFGTCGGCDFLHIAPEHHNSIKQNILREHFLRNHALHILPSHIDTVTLPTFNERTRAKVMLVDKQGAFRRKKSHRLVPFSSCPLLHPELNNIIQSYAQTHTGEYQFEYSTATRQWIPQARKITRFVVNQPLVQSQGSFFQSSEHAAEILVRLFQKTLTHIAPKTLVDLYAGVGLFSRFAEQEGISVTAVETAPTSVRDFAKNAPASKITRKPVEQWNPDDRVDMIVADPPRSGLPPQLPSLIASTTEAFLSISCDAATFARDAVSLTAAGFTMHSLTIADLFPGTRHFETVALFLKK